MNTVPPSPTLGYGRLAMLIAGRFVLNTVFRIAYPLLPFVALRFAVSEETATWIVTANVLCGLASPIGGWLGERIGYRPTMLLGLALTVGGVLLAALAPTFAVLVVAFALCGTGAVVYQPAMQAYVSALTPYQARGRAMGLVELSWALAGILGVPPLMRLVQLQADSRGAFLVLALALTVVLVGTLWLPTERRIGSAEGAGLDLRGVLGAPGVRGLGLFILLAMAGTETFYIAQPSWTTSAYGATLTDLGTIAFVYGIGELLGSSASAFFTDRLGKLRAAALGFGLTATVYLVLPLAASTWVGYIACYLLLAVCVEFAIVATLTLASTVSLVGRAAIMALAITAMQIGRAFGSQLGVPLLERSSLGLVGVVAAVLVLGGTAVALRYVQETERQVLHEPV